MRKIRVGINGMGRIGKNLCRVIVKDFQEYFEIVGANDVVPAQEIAESLRRDSVHGGFPAAVNLVDEQTIQLGPHRLNISTEQDAANIPWGPWDVDTVFECSRFYLTTDKASAHLQAGAKQVIMSAPPKDDTPMMVVGVNADQPGADVRIISNASCTTNCLAPIVKGLDDEFGVISGLISTTHAATSDQQLVDVIGRAKDRAALNNIIPTSTGAARAIGKVLPHLEGRLNGTALRVPVDDGSVLEAVLVVQGTHTADAVNAALKRQAEVQNRMSAVSSVLYVGADYEVSADCIGAPWSSMVLAENTLTVPTGENTLVKLTAFYDNEIGYAYRMADLAILLASAS